MRTLLHRVITALEAVLAPVEGDCPVVIDGQTQCGPRVEAAAGEHAGWRDRCRGGRTARPPT